MQKPVPTAGIKNLSSLAKNTKEVLTSLSELKELQGFTFVGGSALSIYLDHRLSEDLDFFSWKDELDSEALLTNIKKRFAATLKIESISKKQLNLQIAGVRVDFFANGWAELKNNEPLLNNISIAPLKLLTSMKLNTLFLRAKFRDYYDLYVINKGKYTIEEMYNIIKEYMPEINKKLFQMAIVFTKDIEEDNIRHLKPKYSVNLDKISKHFEKEVYKWLKR